MRILDNGHLFTQLDQERDREASPDHLFLDLIVPSSHPSVALEEGSSSENPSACRPVD